MIELTKKNIKDFEILKKIYLYSNPERTGLFFISGSSIDDKNQYGLPKIVQICPQMGVDWSVSYIRKNEQKNYLNIEGKNLNKVEIEQYIILKKMLEKINKEFSDLYFICGNNNEKDINGLPTEIYICNSELNKIFTYLKK